MQAAFYCHPLSKSFASVAVISTDARVATSAVRNLAAGGYPVIHLKYSTSCEALLAASRQELTSGVGLGLQIVAFFYQFNSLG